MNTQPNVASCYRGRITISLEERSGNRKDGSERPQENLVKPVKPLKPLPMAAYTVKVLVLFGANLPRTKNVMSVRGSNYSVQVSVADAFVVTPSLKAGKDRAVDFGKAGVLTRAFKASPDANQVPDVILTLLKGQGNGTPIAYKRISAVELLEGKVFGSVAVGADRVDEGEPIATWVHLKEDKAVDAIHDAVFPGRYEPRRRCFSCAILLLLTPPPLSLVFSQPPNQARPVHRRSRRVER